MNPWARLLGVLLTLSLLAGCGASPSVLERTARNLDEIRSGELHYRMALRPQGAGEPFSVEVEGPFRFPEDGGVAEADLRYRQSLGEKSKSARLFVDGSQGWVELDGERRELTEVQLEQLRLVPDEDGGLLSGLKLDAWFESQETLAGPGETLVITGRADPARALEGLMRLAGGMGEKGFGLEGESRARFRRAVDRAHLTVVTSEDDALLRRLRCEIDLGLAVPSEIEAAVGDLEGARLTYDLRISSPNGDVSIGP